MEEVRLMNVLIDVNVLLDIFLAREPWLSDAQAVWTAHYHRTIVGHIAAHGVTNLFYVARRNVGVEKARDAVRLCLRTFEVIPIGRSELEFADTLGGPDFEDDLVIACALAARLDAIVTRDPKGFNGSPLPIYSPAELVTRLSKGDDA